jgi:hypothetical protein
MRISSPWNGFVNNCCPYGRPRQLSSRDTAAKQTGFALPVPSDSSTYSTPICLPTSKESGINYESKHIDSGINLSCYKFHFLPPTMMWEVAP